MMMKTIVMLSFACALTAAAQALDATTTELLKSAGATQAAVKAPYGQGINSLALGYNDAGTIVAGVAVKNIKSYSKSDAIVMLVPTNGSYEVAHASLASIEEFRGKSKDKAKEALAEIETKSFADEKEARALVDTASGATRYKKAIYIGSSHLSTSIVKEIEAKPSWTKTKLQ